MDNIKLLNVPYGASELKAVAPKYTFRGFISALAIYALISGGIILKGHLDVTAEVPEDKPVARYFVLDEFPSPSIKETEEPEEVTQSKNSALKDLTAMTPKPVSKVEAEIQTTSTQDELDNINVPVSREGEENAENVNPNGTVGHVPETPIVPEEEPIKPPTVKSTYEPYEVQKVPNVLNHGQIQGRMQYPAMALQQEIEGKVSVRILVGKDGSIMRIGSMSGNSIFHDEVEEKINGLEFEPAILNGQPVSCWVTVPFNFKLKSKFGND